MMELVFTDFHSMMLIALLGGSLFFWMATLRELNDFCLEGFLHFALALFFGSAHFFLWFHGESAIAKTVLELGWGFFGWLSLAVAPALIILYLIQGAYRMAVSHFRPGLIRIFFGITLLFYLFVLGADWPTDAKGIIVGLYCLIWLDIELIAIDT